jgi:hypothetical protein
VSSEERQEYEETILRPNNSNIEATSDQDFRFDLLGTRNSLWNKSAARVFADLAIRQLCLPNTVEMFEAIRHAFTAHLGRIIRRYKHSLKSKPEQLAEELRDRRRTRKYQVAHSLLK